MNGWSDAETLQAALGIGRSTFFRRVSAGAIESTTIGGSRFYRPNERDGMTTNGTSPKVQVRPDLEPNGTEPKSATGPNGTERDSDRTGLLALVSKYETRIDALLVDHQAATQRAAALAVELEAERGRSAAASEAARGQVALAQLEADHARQLAERDRAREAAAAEAARLEAERAREAAARVVEAARAEAERDRAAVEVEHAARLDRERRAREESERDRAAVEAAHVVEVERLRAAATADLERAIREREAATARAAALEALARLSWWRFGAKRRARAALEGRMLAP